MNGYKIVLLKAIFMLYKLPESERVCSGICSNRLVGHNQRAAGLGDFAHLAVEVFRAR